MKSALCEMHDMFGNRTALNYPSGRRLTYELDELDRVQTMTENVGATIGRPVAEYAYQGPFRVKTRKSGNGTRLDVAYDAMRRITQYQNNFVGTGQGPVLGIAGFDYGYNKEGMRTYENYNPGIGETNQQSRARVFSYDSLYQITGVKYDVLDPIAEIQNPGTQPFSKQVTYDFDNSGNRNTVETRHGVSLPETTNYQSNSLNQYTQIDSGVFGYDQVGNMTQGVIYLDDLQNPGQKTPVQARFIYDYQNNLIRAEQVIDNQVLGTYIYDVLGRRAYKNAWDRESSAYQATYFWYDGVECVEETDDAGSSIAVYTFGIGIDEAIYVEYPVASDQYSQTGTYWYHTDVLGSVVAITDSDGAVVERYKYDIYGEATVLEPDGQTVRAESMIGNRILYTGREYDAETGLYYYRARYYHAQIGRFISVDPIGADGLGNLFAYVSNSPANWYDPYGLAKGTPTANFGIDPALWEVLLHGSDPQGEIKYLESISSGGKCTDCHPVKQENSYRLNTIPADARYWINAVRGSLLDLSQAGEESSGEYETLWKALSLLSKLEAEGGEVTSVTEWFREEIAFAMSSSGQISKEWHGGNPISVGGNYESVEKIEGGGIYSPYVKSEAEILAEIKNAVHEGNAAGFWGLVTYASLPFDIVGIGSFIKIGFRALRTGFRTAGKEVLEEGVLNARRLSGRAEITAANKGVRTLEKRIAVHEKKLSAFKANPTPAPGTERLSVEIQQRSIGARIRHLEKEIQTFRENIEKLQKGGQ